ncbi:MAG: LacI family DNA-binding transcriptional regulator [Lachnospiraceae bacterium]|nr:LacI family DNA-binding transcriptional regulator [Lachnospiraceae bacterium]
MATIKDVAREAGVAVETVSRVLNNRGYISEKTRDKVYAAMQNIGYTPNAFAQGLSRQNMDCIVVIVPHIVHPYFAKVISSIENEAARRGYKTFLYNSNGDAERESFVLKICQSSFMSGALLFSADISEETLKSIRIPTVLVERNAIGNAVSVQCDNKKGGELAAKHLISKGCHNLIVLGTLNNIDMPGDSRDNEFVRICEDKGLKVSRYRATSEHYVSMDYHDIIIQALNENPDCDGIFATSDLIASQIIQECARRGLSIPGDIKLVGFDDVQLARLTTPTLTTIRQPIHNIAVAAIEAIEKLSRGENVNRNIVLPVSLIEREST